MSLDVSLSFNRPASEVARQAIFIRRDGSTVEITRDEWDDLNPGVEPAMATVNASNECDEVFSDNITHNLVRMADAAGIYDACWRPDENGITKAAQLIGPLMDGLRRLRASPGHFKRYNPENGWGDYDGLVGFTENYLTACRQHPDADVSVSR